MVLDSEKLLDGVGWQILHALQENARVTYAELGRRVSMSLPAVSDRVRRMEEAGIITGYHATVSMEKVGLPISAFIRISTSREGCSQLVALATQLSEVRECHRITGTDSYVLKISVASISHLEEIIDRLMPLGPFMTSIVLSSPVDKHIVERLSGDT
jgi:Lrp/AsnC family leucine-responsive transcriptional regulator